MSKLAGLCLLAGILVAGLIFPAAGGLGALSNQVSAAVPEMARQLLNTPAPQVTQVTAADGSPIATLYDQYRLPARYEDISDPMKAAVLSIEDRNFFSEGAMNPRAVVRAVLNNAGGGSTQGASTITQQYVKNYLINVLDRNDAKSQEEDRSDTMARKLREAQLAVIVDRSQSKQQILANYLNVVSYGNQTYGVGAAARYYFGETPDKLSIAQSAMLAGMVNNPSRYNPYTYPQETLQRRNVVIDAMAAAKSITPEQAAAAKGEALGVQPEKSAPPASCYAAAPDSGFLCDYAVDYLEKAGLSQEQIKSGGYTIQTTLDPRISRAAKDAADRRVPSTQQGVANPFVIVKPGQSSHDVVAMVSNRSYGTDAHAGETSYNQPANVSVPFGAGSVFKLFTTAAAMEKGTAGLSTPLPNPGAQCFPVPGSRSCATVHNDGGYPNPIPLRDALATSPNVAFTDLELRTGMPDVIATAAKLGLRQTMRTNMHGDSPGPAPDGASVPSTYTQPQDQFNQGNIAFTLGFSPFSPLELTNVAATLADHGRWCPPNPIKQVTDRYGTPVPIAQQPCEQVVPPGLANTLVQGLGNDVKPGGTSAESAQAARWTRPTAAKTGTTQDNESVAFLGITNSYAATSVVYADGSHPGTICATNPPVIQNGCKGAFGGTIAAPTFYDALGQVLGGQPAQPLPPADPKYLAAR
ncbi:transglycosylase domain-containing protein [Amycolatopsis acididurans]|uniref:transglycosylase domain-containing protein n=1 Tax=Amycolatopsis acididurans TaxID=2724524 RepID=UPI0028B0E661|nr:transglycosylase domain-containing protein [Amycolatopsis acididurans]